MASDADFAVIIPAAGRGSRFGGDKLACRIGGRYVLEYVIGAFIERPDVAVVVIARDAGARFPVLDALAAHPKLARCGGGENRAESVLRGLEHLAQVGISAEFVAIHDAARPAVSQELIDRVFDAARREGAAVPAVPVTDTIKRVSEGRVCETPPRRELVAVQTPQAMRREWLAAAYAAWTAGLEALTDDVQLLEAAGRPVSVVPGDFTNLKVTRADDLEVLKRLLRLDKV